MLLCNLAASSGLFLIIFQRKASGVCLVEDHLRSDIDDQLKNFWSDQLTFVSKRSTEVQLSELDQVAAEVASQLSPCGEIHKF